MVDPAADDEHRLDSTVADVCASLGDVFDELTVERCPSRSCGNPA